MMPHMFVGHCREAGAVHGSQTRSDHLCHRTPVISQNRLQVIRDHLVV